MLLSDFTLSQFSPLHYKLKFYTLVAYKVSTLSQFEIQHRTRSCRFSVAVTRSG